jgi:hypothetical protein
MAFGMEDDDFNETRQAPIGVIALSDDEEFEDEAPIPAPPALKPVAVVQPKAPIAAKVIAAPKVLPTPPAAAPAPAPAPVVKKTAPAKAKTVAKKTVAPKPAEAKVIPPKPVEETVQVQVAIPKSFFDSFAESIGTACTKTTRAVRKRVNPSDYVLDPKNHAFYLYVLGRIESATCIEDLRPLLEDQQYGDALKALFDRRAYATDLERTTISDIIRTGKIKDGVKLEELSRIVEATERAQDVCSAATLKVLDLIAEAAHTTAGIAQRSATRLPRSQTLPPLEQEEEEATDDGNNNNE